jgi:hypothetical protein
LSFCSVLEYKDASDFIEILVDVRLRLSKLWSLFKIDKSDNGQSVRSKTLNWHAFSRLFIIASNLPMLVV